MAQYLQKRPRTDSDRPSDGSDVASGFPGSLIALGEFLSLTAWDDGGKRKPGSVAIFSEEGLLKACLNDKDAGTICFVSADGWTCLLDTVESGLREGTLEWRKARPLARK